ncbi:MAG: N-acetyltransferase [Caulobacteraceae bacterium]|nr:MAG: N-acetyltransferase [Caulobacteraceae bacterium]
MSLILRPFTLADAPAVNALCDQVWWPTRSLAGWRWMMDGPPGGRPAGEAATGGWVCEQDGEVRAFLGNSIQRFDWLGAALYGSTGHTLVADPRAKGAARRLLRALVNQQNRFAVYTFNANALSSGFYRHYAMTPWPNATHAVKYSWRTDLAGVAAERLTWKLSRLTGLEAARAGPERFMRAVPARRLRLPASVTALSVQDIGPAFDALCADVVATGLCVARRDAATLRWRLTDPDNTRAPILLAYEEDGRLAGYLLAQFAKQTQLDQVTLEIIDLFALPRRSVRAIPTLVGTLVANARRLGAVRVRMQTISPDMDQLLRQTPGARRQITHGHCHTRFYGQDALQVSGDWRPTPYDGDYGLVLRPPPLRPPARGEASGARAPGAAAESLA